MDISNLVTVDNANEGVVKQVVLFGKKQPFAIRIYGDDSDAVQSFSREKIKRLKLNPSEKEMNDEMIDELLDSVDDSVVVRMGGIYSCNVKTGELIDEPVTLDGKTLGNDEKSYRYLIERIPPVKDFVLKISKDRKDFLSKGKKN